MVKFGSVTYIVCDSICESAYAATFGVVDPEELKDLYDPNLSSPFEVFSSGGVGVASWIIALVILPLKEGTHTAL